MMVWAPSSLTVKGQGFEIVWEEIDIGDDRESVVRNGRPAVYQIEARAPSRTASTRLPGGSAR